MGKLLCLALSALLAFTGCQTAPADKVPEPEKVEAVDNSESTEAPLGPPELVKQIPLFEMGGLKVPLNIKRMIYHELSRFPQTHNQIASIAVVLRLTDGRGRALSGIWDGDNIILAYRKALYMQWTLWHEMAHAQAQNLDKKQRRVWIDLYNKRYKEAGLSPRSPWSTPMTEAPKGFPTAYSTTNYHEFIAEHLETAMTDSDTYVKRFPEEYKLLKKHDFLPKDWGEPQSSLLNNE